MVRLNPADLLGEWSIEGELEQTGVTEVFIRRFLAIKYKNCKMFLLFGAHSCGSCCWGEVCSSPSVRVRLLLCVCIIEPGIAAGSSMSGSTFGEPTSPTSSQLLVPKDAGQHLGLQRDI